MSYPPPPYPPTPLPPQTQQDWGVGAGPVPHAEGHLGQHHHQPHSGHVAHAAQRLQRQLPNGVGVAGGASTERVIPLPRLPLPLRAGRGLGPGGRRPPAGPALRVQVRLHPGGGAGK